MADKILCPYCGAEMERSVVVIDTTKDDCKTCLLCTQCHAQSPLCNTWTEAKEAALRRYTPPIKPLPLKEIKAAKVVWVEDPEVEYEEELYPAIYWGVGNVEWAVFIADIDDGNEQGWYYMPDYGKLWRAWARKPTDEERSAAEWEA